MNYRTGTPVPSIYGLLSSRKHLVTLIHSVLYTNPTLSRGDCELLAAFVSQQNKCLFSYALHRSVANEYLGSSFVTNVLERQQYSLLSPAVKLFFDIAATMVSKGAFNDFPDTKTLAATGAGNQQLHDARLLISVIDMLNRYVNSLGPTGPERSEREYQAMAKIICKDGYLPVF